MLTYEDCVALCELSAEEIEAIAEHEHVPPIVAAELGSYLIHRPGGELKISRIILADIEAARRRGDVHRCAELKLVLRHFVECHPAAKRSSGRAKRRSGATEQG